MADTTTYIVQSFTRRGKRLLAMPPIKALDEADARRRAMRGATMTGNVGAVAFSVTGDLEADSFEEPTILARFGTTPATIEKAGRRPHVKASLADPLGRHRLRDMCSRPSEGLPWNEPKL